MAMLRPFDYILTGLALVLSFLPFFLTVQQAGSNQPNLAVIKMNGQVVDQFVLEEGAGHFEKTYYPREGLYNTIEQEGDRIRVKEDNSPDQVAVRRGWISEVGETAINLPHQFIIEIQGAEEFSEDDLILPHF